MLIFIFVVIAIIFLYFVFFGNKDGITPGNSPTPTTSPINDLILQSSEPLNNSVNVEKTKEIVFTFSRPVTADDFTVLIGPETEHTVVFRGKTVIIKPKTTWSEGTPYRITIQYADLSRVPDGLNFTVVGTSIKTLPNTRPNPTEIQNSEDLQKEARPDVYLSNYAPFETDAFTISSEYRTQPTGHFAFIVQLKEGQSENEVRNAVEAWTISHSLTSEQYNSLDIEFR